MRKTRSEAAAAYLSEVTGMSADQIQFLCQQWFPRLFDHPEVHRSEFLLGGAIKHLWLEGSKMQNDSTSQNETELNVSRQTQNTTKSDGLSKIPLAVLSVKYNGEEIQLTRHPEKVPPISATLQLLPYLQWGSSVLDKQDGKSLAYRNRVTRRFFDPLRSVYDGHARTEAIPGATTDRKTALPESSFSPTGSSDTLSWWFPTPKVLDAATKEPANSLPQASLHRSEHQRLPKSGVGHKSLAAAKAWSGIWLPGYRAYHDINSYCQYASQHSYRHISDEYAEMARTVDRTQSCALGTTISIVHAKKILDLFTDKSSLAFPLKDHVPYDYSNYNNILRHNSYSQTRAEISTVGENRGSYLLFMYLEQPFPTLSVCESHGQKVLARIGGAWAHKILQNARNNVTGKISMCSMHFDRLRDAESTNFRPGYWLDGIFANGFEMRSDLIWHMHHIATAADFLPTILHRQGGFITTRGAGAVLVSGFIDPLISRLRMLGFQDLVDAQSLDVNKGDGTNQDWYGNEDETVAFSFFENRTFPAAQKPHVYSNSLHSLGQFIEYNGETQTRLWDDPFSLKRPIPVMGMDGTQAPPIFGGKNSERQTTTSPNTYLLWWQAVSRPLRMIFTQDVTYFGVNLRRYRLGEWTRFEGGQTDCQFVSELSTDLKPGIAHSVQALECPNSDERAPLNLVDLEKKEGLPLFLGYPHFLFGVEHSIQHGISGLKPSSLQHESKLDVEPMSGGVMYHRLRWQVNLRLEKPGSTAVWHNRFITPTCEVDGQRLSSHVTQSTCSLYLPIFWSEEANQMGREQAFQFKSDVYKPLELAQDTLPVISFIIGPVLGFGALLMLVAHVRLLGQNKHRNKVGILRHSEAVSLEEMLSSKLPITDADGILTDTPCVEAGKGKLLAQPSEMDETNKTQNSLSELETKKMSSPLAAESASEIKRHLQRLKKANMIKDELAQEFAKDFESSIRTATSPPKRE